MYTARLVLSTDPTSYGPMAWTGTRFATVGPQEAYAPVSKSAWTRTPVRRPSASAPNVAAILAGWRFVVDAMDSGRGYTARTGWSSRRAAMAMSGWRDRSSLPPNPPPQALGMTRTRSAGSPRISASSSRSMYGVCVVAKTSTRPSTTRAVPASGSM